MMDIKEDRENHKLMYEDCKLLQLLAEDMNDCVMFMNNEILNKNEIYNIMRRAMPPPATLCRFECWSSGVPVYHGKYNECLL